MNKLKQILAIAVPIIATIVFSGVLQTYLLDSPEKLKFITSQFGSYLILIYIILQTITTVIPPLSAAFMQIAVLAVFGPVTGNILIYLVSTPLYIVNFLLAKKYGTPWVEKVMGEKALEGFDAFITDAGTPTLVLLKIFQANVFDFIAYVYGLTKINARTFVWVNVIAGIPSAYLSYLVLNKFKNFAVGIVTLQIMTIIFAAGYITIRRYMKRMS